MECTNTRAVGCLTPFMPCSRVRQESWPPPRKEATAQTKQPSSGIGRRAGLLTATKNTGSISSRPGCSARFACRSGTLLPRWRGTVWDP
eukprot:1562433-Amphidinium_carterae.1